MHIPLSGMGLDTYENLLGNNKFVLCKRCGVDPYEHTTEYSENETKWTGIFPVRLKEFEGLDSYKNTYLLGILAFNEDPFTVFRPLRKYLLARPSRI